jgi:hypothetical protein
MSTKASDREKRRARALRLNLKRRKESGRNSRDGLAATTGPNHSASVASTNPYPSPERPNKAKKSD